MDSAKENRAISDRPIECFDFSGPPDGLGHLAA